MLVIGLTGGIGSGKSTVAKLFEKRNIPVIDTDIIARELVTPGQPALKEIINTFSSTVIKKMVSLIVRHLPQQLSSMNMHVKSSKRFFIPEYAKPWLKK